MIFGMLIMKIVKDTNFVAFNVSFNILKKGINAR